MNNVFYYYLLKSQTTCGASDTSTSTLRGTGADKRDMQLADPPSSSSTAFGVGVKSNKRLVVDRRPKLPNECMHLLFRQPTENENGGVQFKTVGVPNTLDNKRQREWHDH